MAQSALARTRAHSEAPSQPSLLARTRTGRVQPGIELRAIGGQGARAGAPFLLSGDDVRARATRLDSHIESLHGDMRASLVYADPAKLEADAKAFRAKILADPTNVMTSAWAGVADAFEKEAVLLRAKIASKGAAQVESELSWSRGYQLFYDRWKNFNTKIQGPTSILGGLGPSKAWDMIDGYDVEFRKWYSTFPGKPSAPMPPTEKEIEAAHPDKPLIGKIIDIPWTPILIIGGIAAVAFLLPRLTAAKQAFTPSD